jgi:hypothetical protein
MGLPSNSFTNVFAVARPKTAAQSSYGQKIAHHITLIAQPSA